MSNSVTKSTLAYLAVLVFIFCVSTMSFGKVLEVGDTAETHNKLLENPDTWDDTVPVKGKTELARDVGFETANDPGGASVAFPGSGNIGNNVGFMGVEYGDEIGGETFVQITADPMAAHEFRYMTLATSHTGEKSNATIGIYGYPGFGHASPGNGGEWIDLHGMELSQLNGPSKHAQACWDNTLSIGNHETVMWWKRPGPAAKDVAGNSFFTPINVDANGDTFGDLPVEWRFFVFDLAQKAINECIYNDDCKAGTWDWESWSYETDQPETGGFVYFDAFYFTQTADEACGIGGLTTCVDSISGNTVGSGTSVEPTGKASTFWGRIKSSR